MLVLTWLKKRRGSSSTRLPYTRARVCVCVCDVLRDGVAAAAASSNRNPQQMPVSSVGPAAYAFPGFRFQNKR